MRFVLPIVIALALASCSAGNPQIPMPPDGTAIYQVQGAGFISPLVDRRVTVSGVVTGDFQNGDENLVDNLGGFFLQDEAGDADPTTSDGIYIFDGNGNTDVRVGDRVSVSGLVVEFFGETQIKAQRVEVTGRGSVQPTDITPPSSSTVLNANGIRVADWEAYEGMLVRVEQRMTVVDLFSLERFGSVTLAAGGRVEQFTNAARPNVNAYREHQDRVARRALILDDGANLGNRAPPSWLFPQGLGARRSTIRLGDATESLTGNLRYARGRGAAGLEAFRLMPTATPTFKGLNKVSVSPPPVGGSLRVMSFNALNFFTTPDEGVSRCGPAGRSGCRGADSAQELDRQRLKLVSAILAADAHIVGLMEIENNASESLRMLVDALNTQSRSAWRYIDTGVIGTDAIRVGFIYDAGATTAVGDFRLLTRSVDGRFDDARNRPTLAQSFTSISTGGRLTIAVNHLKSKGSPCDDAGDPDRGDGQGNCNLTRTHAASALADWLNNDRNGIGDDDVLIIGDLNAYRREDPLRALEDQGWTNLIRQSPGTPPYSFAFRGEVGALDHALASTSLLPQIVGAAVWHINADEPPILDYNLDNGRDSNLIDLRSPFRASDHDPVLIGLELSPD